VKGLGWLMQLLTGLALTFLVAYHFLITHIFGSLQLNEVVARFHELKAFYAVLLVVVTFHAFNGLSVIAEEIGRGRLAKAFYVVMAVVMAYGLLLLLSV